MRWALPRWHAPANKVVVLRKLLVHFLQPPAQLAQRQPLVFGHGSRRTGFYPASQNAQIQLVRCEATWQRAACRSCASLRVTMADAPVEDRIRKLGPALAESDELAPRRRLARAELPYEPVCDRRDILWRAPRLGVLARFQGVRRSVRCRRRVQCSRAKLCKHPLLSGSQYAAWSRRLMRHCMHARKRRPSDTGCESHASQRCLGNRLHAPVLVTDSASGDWTRKPAAEGAPLVT